MHNDIQTRLTSIAGKRDFKANVMQTSPAMNYMQKRKKQVNQRAAKKKLHVIGEFKFKQAIKKAVIHRFILPFFSSLILSCSVVIF